MLLITLMCVCVCVCVLHACAYVNFLRQILIWIFWNRGHPWLIFSIFWTLFMLRYKNEQKLASNHYTKKVCDASFRVCVCACICVCVNLFASVLIVPIWSEQSWFRALPCPPYSSIYHRQQWRHTKALGASRWIPSNGSACVTLLNRCAWWQPAAMEISPGRRLLHVSVT